MKADILNLEGKKLKDITLPAQFNEEYRPDLIKRAVLVIQANKRQPYGANPEAGKRASAKLSRRRRNYRGAYGHGISRVPRKTMWRRGRQFGWRGAFAPGTVGGRRSHPPKAEKSFEKKININERRKAIRSAIASTLNKEIVEKRGHMIKAFPLIVENIENIEKTKDVKNVLVNLGLKDELKRIDKRKVRAGKGKSRGRKYRIKKGPLIVVSEDCKLLKVDNIQGVDIAKVNLLNAELLAPGGVAGRLTLWSSNAIQRLEKERLFMNKVKK